MSLRFAASCIIFAFATWPMVAVAVPAKASKTAPGMRQPPAPSSRAYLFEGYGQLPVSFEPNVGQADPRVKFLARSSRYTIFFTATEAVIVLGSPKPGPPGFSQTPGQQVIKKDETGRSGFGAT